MQLDSRDCGGRCTKEKIEDHKIRVRIQNSCMVVHVTSKFLEENETDSANKHLAHHGSKNTISKNYDSIGWHVFLPGWSSGQRGLLVNLRCVFDACQQQQKSNLFNISTIGATLLGLVTSHC